MNGWNLGNAAGRSLDRNSRRLQRIANLLQRGNCFFFLLVEFVAYNLSYSTASCRGTEEKWKFAENATYELLTYLH